MLGELEQEEHDNDDGRSSVNEDALLAYKQGSSEIWIPATSCEYNNDLFTDNPMGKDIIAGSSVNRWELELPALEHAGVPGDHEANSGAQEDLQQSKEESLMQSVESSMFLWQG